MVWEIIIPESWLKVNSYLLSPQCKTVLLLGCSDCGKTTFLQYLLSLLAGKKQTAVVDSDLGQSHLGPPTTIGWGLIKDVFSSWEEIELGGMYFVGATSPSKNIVQVLLGTKLMTEEAARRSEIVLVDTCGLVTGIGSFLKEKKIELIRPDLVISLERTCELDHLFRPYQHTKVPQILRLPVAVDGKKTCEERANYRQLAFSRYFKNARFLKISWNNLAFKNTDLFNSACCFPDVRSLEDELQCGVLFATVQENILHLIVKIHPEEARQNRLKQDYFQVSYHLISKFNCRLAGLKNKQNSDSGLGILRYIDFEKKEFSLYSPVLEEIALVTLGSLRVSLKGEQIEANIF